MRYLQRPADLGGRGISAMTANQRYRSISRFFKFLVEIDEIHETPLAKMSPPKMPEHLVPVVPVDALRRLLKSLSARDLDSRRDRAIMSILIDCGLRVSETAALDLEDVDLEGRDLIVHQGKNRRDRRLRFTRETRADLQRYLLSRRGHPHAADAALWVGKRGRLTKSGVYRVVCKKAGLGHVHPHALRHTAAHRSKSGLNARATVRILG